MLTAIKGVVDSSTIMWDFNTPLTPMDRSSRQKINTETQTLNDTTDQIDLIAIYRTFWGFPGGSDSKESACNVGDLGSIPGLGKSPGERKGYPLQYSGLENSTDRGTWQATVHRVSKNQTQLSDFHFHFSLSYIDLSGVVLQKKNSPQVISHEEI